MKRFAEDDLKAWYRKKTRTPLILRGARQVGKSTLVKIFSENEKLDLIEINLEKTKLISTEKSDFSLSELLDEIQLKTKKRITNNSLLFFDEIQESPYLLKLLRYFFEEKPGLAVISAGSLLEFALKDDTFSFPVGRVEFYHLGPMTFSEFLLATDQEFLLSKISSLDFSEEVHEEALKQLKIFYFTGGMPRVVKTYAEEKSFVSAREIQDQIIETYAADFSKYNSRIKSERVEKIFYSSTHYLGEKLIYSKLDQEKNSRDIKKIIELLFDAKVLLKCMHSDGNSSPLMGEIDERIFKIFFLDIGLLGAMKKIDPLQFDENLKGLLAEQFVAQHLGRNLFYWLKDRGSQKGEIDFLFSKGNQIIPIEVKSTSVGHLKSLFYFCREKKTKLAIRASTLPFSEKNIMHKIQEEEVRLKLLSIPLYAIEYLNSLLSENKK